MSMNVAEPSSDPAGHAVTSPTGRTSLAPAPRWARLRWLPPLAAGALVLVALLLVSEVRAGADPEVAIPRLVADLVVTEDGAVIEGLDIVGDIEVVADDVTIRDVQVTSRDSIPILVGPSARNLVVEDSTLTCGHDVTSYGIGHDHYRAQRVTLVGCGLGFRDGVAVEVIDSSRDTAAPPTTADTAVPPTTAPVGEASPGPDDTRVAGAREEPTSEAALQWSDTADRSGPANLAGATTPATIYIFLTDVDSAVASVHWYLDDELVRDDDFEAPWDMNPAAAGQSGLVTIPATQTQHVATAVLRLRDGTTETIQASFTVQEGDRDQRVQTARAINTAGSDARETTSGWPDATNSGVRDQAALERSGSVTVTTDGAVIENLDINGRIIVKADNVTIRNVRVTGNASHLIRNHGRDLLVEDTTLIGQRPCAAGIAFTNYTARRVDISGCADGLKANSDVVIEDSYIHELRKWSGTHNDGIQGTGGSNIVIRNNRIEGPLRASVSAIKFDSLNRHLDNVTIEENLIAGGGFSIYLEAGEGMDPPTNARIINNVFVEGSMTWNWIRVDHDRSQLVSGNVWDDGRPVD